MTRAFEEHWLSAYLDDELSAEERALVDQRLEEDPVARELLEDLKRVRGLVSTLPRWQGKEFYLDPATLATIRNRGTDAVVQPSPLEMVASSPSGSAQDITDTRAATTKLGGRSVAAQRYYWSGLLALAAGITALFFAGPYMRRAAENREIARGPATKTTLPAASARSSEMNQTVIEDKAISPGSAGEQPRYGIDPPRAVPRDSEAWFNNFADSQSRSDKRSLAEEPRPDLGKELAYSPQTPQQPREKGAGLTDVQDASKSMFDANQPPPPSEVEAFANAAPASPAADSPTERDDQRSGLEGASRGNGAAADASERVGARPSKGLIDKSDVTRARGNSSPSNHVQADVKAKAEEANIASATNTPTDDSATMRARSRRNARETASDADVRSLAPADSFRLPPLTPDFETAPALGPNYILAYSVDWEPSEVELALKQIVSVLHEVNEGSQESMRFQLSKPNDSPVASNAVSEEAAGNNLSRRADAGERSATRTTGSATSDDKKIVVASLPETQSPEAWLLSFNKLQPLKPLSPALAQPKQETAARGTALLKQQQAADARVKTDAPKELVLFVNRLQAERLLATLESKSASASDAKPAANIAAEEKRDVELQGVPIAPKPVDAKEPLTSAGEKRPQDKIILILRQGK